MKLGGKNLFQYAIHIHANIIIQIVDNEYEDSGFGRYEY